MYKKLVQILQIRFMKIMNFEHIFGEIVVIRVVYCFKFIKNCDL